MTRNILSCWLIAGISVSLSSCGGNDTAALRDQITLLDQRVDQLEKKLAEAESQPPGEAKESITPVPDTPPAAARKPAPKPEEMEKYLGLLEEMYKSCGIGNVRILQDSVVQGEPVTLSYSLQNTGEGECHVPVDPLTKKRVVGNLRVWIERVGDVKQIPSVGMTSGGRYLLAGMPIYLDGPLQPGTYFEKTLRFPTKLTARTAEDLYAPGDYVITIEHHGTRGGLRPGSVIASTQVGFKVTRLIDQTNSNPE